jgi:zinc transport system permease protein
MPDFVVYALVAGLSLALVAGPLGSFVVWRRMSYFGDTLAHSALLGIAIGLLSGANLQLSIIAVCIITALILVSMSRQDTVATDTLLGIIAHSALAIGVVLLALSGSTQISLEAYLFGELLTISTPDLLLIVLVSMAVLLTLGIFWNRFLSFTVHEELAGIEGVPVQKLRYLLVILMAVTTAAAARQLSRGPEQMAVLASIIGCLSVLVGLFAAFRIDTPVGPSIVVTATVVFFILHLFNFAAKKDT